MTRNFILILLCFAAIMPLSAVEKFVSFEPGQGQFPLISNSVPVPLCVDESVDEGIFMAVRNLARDIGEVCGAEPRILNSPAVKCVIIGSCDMKLIRKLIAGGKLDGGGLEGKYEKYVIQVVDNPLEGVDQALVIAGSDKRGTIYGIYELSAQAGVSPWYYWADVPVRKQRDVYISRGAYTDGEPAVAYRGIFLNDEAPALTGWAMETFGGYNSRFYEKVFELILRLKGNFLWPAMWGNAFYHDDPENGVLADKMGIVVGTSHHEPMGRAHHEWYINGGGAWNYKTNAEVLREFWRGGMERMKDWEALVTVGMRGDGDEPMSDEADIALLEKIVGDQRKIIEDVTGRKARETPQVWALYKEVQDYYDKGMRVPDDVTLLLCDDNWGNVRKLPNLNDKPRKGGYGMYYHFDYVGGPRNYKWINVSQAQRIWEQMNLTYEYGVRKLWVVNVGDLKPMEYPITFFLDMAWDPKRFSAGNIIGHTESFCAQQFGGGYAKEAARIINLYTKYNRRVTPELLNAGTYSFNYGEWERVVNDYNALAADAYTLKCFLPAEYSDAYDQLVLFPVQACSNLYNMYYAHAKNLKLAAENNPEADYWADKVGECFKRDSALMYYYNRIMAGGKWNHMMDQAHIGYTSWQQPEKQVMPAVKRVAQAGEPYVFAEKDGYVSMEAEHYTLARSGDGAEWVVIPDLGKTLSGITTMPVTRAPHDMVLEYEVELVSAGEAKVAVMVSPTLNFNDNKGLGYEVSIAGQKNIVNINGKYTAWQMERWQAESINRTESVFRIEKPGRYTLRFRPLDPGIVLQKIMIDMGGLRPSYLGAPETIKQK